ncbi:hypothetical protein JNW90_13745 [Micromonospora sp. STR1s_5]|nr:hypothetical protein [Micromonospora sp. STR1s_5]
MAKNKEVGLWGATAVSDTMSFFNIPGSSMVQKSVEAAYERRTKAAQDVLLEMLSKHGPQTLDDLPEGEMDDLIQMLMRYGKAAMEGAARENLRLLAAVIAGLKRNRALSFDKFQECANVLETLTRDEILFLGHFYRHRKANPGKNDYNAFRKEAEQVFGKDRFESVAAGLVRTGMLLPIAALSGSNIYVPSERFFTVCELAEIGDEE